MGSLMRSMDWSTTSLGPVDGWPQSLRTTVSICLASDLPICVIWGPGHVQLYNDAYRVICGDKHPRSMGQNFAECWQEAWPVIGEAHDSALAGDTAFLETQRIFLQRHGYLEECFFTFSFSPIRDEVGRVGGLFHPVIEMTPQMLSARRTRALRDLNGHTSKAKSVGEALSLAAQSLAECDLDLPFVLLYALDPDGVRARLVGATGVGADAVARLSTVDLDTAEQALGFLKEAARSGSAVQVDGIGSLIDPTSIGPHPEPPRRALALPIILPGGDKPAAVFVAGISPWLPMNEAYRSFYDLLASGVTTAAANAAAYDDERRRAKSLAELDRAKTAFFSNVSHEFRTPLTLMLGPVEDALAEADGCLPPLQRERLEVVHRNGLRLQRLVNGLLDFSRIEAGRVRAAYEPTDLADFTADLASNFRSACEKAGLTLHVDCPRLGEPVFVDRPMWEKVVLNLLSNAFKFTFAGEIAVSMSQVGRAAELRVRDTGTGVSAADIPRLFERFYRVDNARGRTHEGSGIGLTLVQELVKLHGGSISVESELGRHTTFTVRVPLGSQHLPRDQLGSTRTAAQSTGGASPFVEEALRWLPGADRPSSTDAAPLSLQDDPTGPAASCPPPDDNDDRPRVLVADDNADMRQYIVRLLGEHYCTDAVPDGEAALAAARQRRPDLILTDVMMPRLDGFGLLQALRADPRTCHVPVIMLSARAGEESRVDGMAAGADDYLVKPFSGRELLARVTAHLQMAAMRREANASLREGEERLRMALTAACMVAWRYDPSTGQVVLSDNAAEVFGLSPGTTLDHIDQAFDLVHPEDMERHRATVNQAVEMGGSYLSQFRIARSDNGAVIWLEDRGHAMCQERGAPVRLIGVVMDITERKRGEEERDRLVVRLREQDQRKDEFLATLAHELRNPLAPIRNGLQIMRLARGDTDACDRVGPMMERQVAQMVHLIDDLLDLSRISLGKIDLRKERIELAQAIHQVIETSRPSFEQAGHELLVETPPGPIHVDADLTRLTQVFSNLLNNAAKFTPRGGRIRLAAHVQGTEAVVSVTDNGIGIEARMLAHVFEMFTQVDRNLEGSQGGLGIGLSIVQRLVEMHGGWVEARSEGRDRGSEFVVHLPIALSLVQHESADPVAPVRPTAGQRVLVVDDNLDAASSLSMMLTMMGNETRTAHDGLEALDVAAAFRPEVVLLDIGMPKLNGYEACRRIRQQAWGRDMVLIALSGWGQEADKRCSLEAGFDAHWVKPVAHADLEHLLTEAASVKV